MILAIDPGCAESAYVLIGENLKPVEFGKVGNEILYHKLKYKYFSSTTFNENNTDLVIEMVASYGMAVGVEVFETVFWIGRFWEVGMPMSVQRIYRKDEKINLCGNMKAKDSNIIQALIDRFAYGVPNKGKGTKNNPGWFYGFSKDIWQAYAVGVTYYDKYIKGSK